jgi:hypothetical protein
VCCDRRRRVASRMQGVGLSSSGPRTMSVLYQFGYCLYVGALPGRRFRYPGTLVANTGTRYLWYYVHVANRDSQMTKDGKCSKTNTGGGVHCNFLKPEGKMSVDPHFATVLIKLLDGNLNATDFRYMWSMILYFLSLTATVRFLLI